MAVTPSVKVTKRFTFRDNDKLWSNRYHFSGGTPDTTAKWNTLFDAVVAAEKAIYTTGVFIVEVSGYAAGSDVPVASKTYAQNGTGGYADGFRVPGEVVALLRWATAARSTKNHPVYLFNYYHGILVQSGTLDTLSPNQKTGIGTYATAWETGFSDGTTTYKRAGPNGADAVGHLVESYVTHRDFPR